jgi:hypothetical protein
MSLPLLTSPLNVKPVKYVKQWPHLGNILHVNQYDSLGILFRRGSAVGQANDMKFALLTSRVIRSRSNSFTIVAAVIIQFCSVGWDLSKCEIDIMSEPGGLYVICN